MSNLKIKGMILLWVFFALVTVCGVSAGLDEGDTAADFTLLGHDGSYYTLYDYTGDVVFINFATWN